MTAAASARRGTRGKVLSMRCIAVGAGSQMPQASSRPESCCWIALSSRSPMMPAPMTPIATLLFFMSMTADPSMRRSGVARHQRFLVRRRIEEVAGTEVGAVAQVAEQAALARRAAVEQLGVGPAEIVGPHEHLAVVVEDRLARLARMVGRGPVPQRVREDIGVARLAEQRHRARHVRMGDAFGALGE